MGPHEYEQGDGYYLTRDWGPFAVFDARGNFKLVDGRYVDYPLAGGGGSKRLASLSNLFRLDYRPDDTGPAAVAKELGLPRTELPIALTGGNLFFDGLGTGFATQILIDENAAMGIPSDQFIHIEYYLSAASRSGRNESLPRTAPKGFYAFKVEEKR